MYVHEDGEQYCIECLCTADDGETTFFNEGEYCDSCFGATIVECKMCGEDFAQDMEEEICFNCSEKEKSGYSNYDEPH